MRYIAGLVIGIVATHVAQRYAPALLWWLFSRGDA